MTSLQSSVILLMMAVRSSYKASYAAQGSVGADCSRRRFPNGSHVDPLYVPLQYSHGGEQLSLDDVSELETAHCEKSFRHHLFYVIAQIVELEEVEKNHSCQPARIASESM